MGERAGRLAEIRERLEAPTPGPWVFPSDVAWLLSEVEEERRRAERYREFWRRTIADYRDVWQALHDGDVDAALAWAARHTVSLGIAPDDTAAHREEANNA